MAVTWDITNLERHRTFGGKSDVINAVHWECYEVVGDHVGSCLLYTSPRPRDKRQARMPSSA